MGLKERLKQRIQKLREDSGLNQKQLAELVGVSPMTISRYERGEHDIDLDTAEAIAKALRVPVERLLEMEPSKPEIDLKQAIQVLNEALPKIVIIPERTEFDKSIHGTHQTGITELLLKRVPPTILGFLAVLDERHFDEIRTIIKDRLKQR